jgi:hypothetical protein
MICYRVRDWDTEEDYQTKALVQDVVNFTGAVPFYTGRYIIEMKDLRNVATILQKKEPFFITIRDQREKLEKELLSTGKCYILVKQEMGTGRTLVLLSNKAQSTLTIADPFKKRPAVEKE